MRQDITTIPVLEMFEPCDGCPICRMRDTLEERVVTYITGAAMMESDVRIETNRLGFCHTHFEQMGKMKRRLAVALIIESHLDEIMQNIENSKPKTKSGFFADKAAFENEETCFVCSQIDWAMVRMIETVCRQWEHDSDFRELYSKQPHFCMPHFNMLVKAGFEKMNKKNYAVFYESTKQIVLDYLAGLKNDVTYFTKMFDYRNAGGAGDWGSSSDSIERAIKWLTSR